MFFIVTVRQDDRDNYRDYGDAADGENGNAQGIVQLGLFLRIFIRFWLGATLPR